MIKPSNKHGHQVGHGHVPSAFPPGVFIGKSRSRHTKLKFRTKHDSHSSRNGLKEAKRTTNQLFSHALGTSPGTETYNT